MYPRDFKIFLSSTYLSSFLCSSTKTCWFSQSNWIFDDDFSLSNKISPQPIAAGKLISAHRIDICQAIPPYFVINPAGFFENIQSKPGSAFSISIIEFLISSNFVSFLSSKIFFLIILFVM